LAEPPSNPLQRPLPDSFVPEAIVARTESHWAMIMAAMLTVMMAVIVVTGVAGALHPSSNVRRKSEPHRLNKDERASGPLA
jgi:hypothetical protein